MKNRQAVALSPLRGLLPSTFYPRLTPWAAFCRRFAAEAADFAPPRARKSSSHARTKARIHLGALRGAEAQPPPEIQVKGSGQECALHTVHLGRTNSRFLRSAVAGAPAPVGMTKSRGVSPRQRQDKAESKSKEGDRCVCSTPAMTLTPALVDISCSIFSTAR
jgi:hypothetical protein